MAEFSWSRIGKAVAEAAGYAEGVRAMLRRISPWLALLGVPLVADRCLPEQYLPASPYGTALWAASLLLAFALSVRAIYVKQRQVDQLLDKEAQARLERRRAVWAAIQDLLLEYEPLRRVPRSKSRRDPEFMAQLQRFETAVGAYWRAANALPVHEKPLHFITTAELRAATQQHLALDIVSGLVEPVVRLANLQLWQSSRMDRVMQESEEADLVRRYTEAEHPELVE